MRVLRLAAPVLLAAGIGSAIAAAPIALRRRERLNRIPLLPSCEVTGGSSVEGGRPPTAPARATSQIDATAAESRLRHFPWDDDFYGSLTGSGSAPVAAATACSSDRSRPWQRMRLCAPAQHRAVSSTAAAPQITHLHRPDVGFELPGARPYGGPGISIGGLFIGI